MSTSANPSRIGARIGDGLALRSPQREALSGLLGLLGHLGESPLDKPASEVSKQLRRLFEATRSPLADKLNLELAGLTLELATGVGKTKLAAAIMAALSSSGICQSFWIVAPRRGIVDKFVRELSPSHPKYLFQGLPELQPPVLLRSDDFADGGLLLRQREGMRIAVATAQWLSNSDRLSHRCEVTGETPVEEMRANGPVVAILDESHHFDAEVWSNIPRRLEASLAIRLTATPTADEAVIYSYPLGRCLRDGLFTKRPVLQVQNLRNTPVVDVDRMALRDAMSCLAKLEPELCAFAAQNGIPAPPPVALVAAKDTEHADAVAMMLIREFGLGEDEVLVIHSKVMTDENLERLLAVESPKSRTRVVVQVFALEEGWDVSNVYVIVPLRAMATYRGIRQLMGRGLRLPFGQRTGVDELDSLSILAYGQATVAEVVRQATEDLGANSVAFKCSEFRDAQSKQQETQKSQLVDEYRGLKLEWPDCDVIPECGQIDLTVLHQKPFESIGGRLNLETLELLPRYGLDDLSDEDWCLAVASTLIQRDSRLSVARHIQVLESALQALLQMPSALKVDGKRATIPDAVALIEETCGSTWQSTPSRYEVVRLRTLAFLDREYTLRSDQPRPSLPATAEIMARGGDRCPAMGFNRSIMTVGLYDSGAEVRMAQRIDQMPEVVWWLRNDPRQLSVPTTDVHSTSPDFIIQFRSGDEARLLLVEVKGRHLWEPWNSPARRQARDLREWARVATEALRRQVDVVFIADDDVDQIASLEDVLLLALDPDRLPLPRG